MSRIKIKRFGPIREGFQETLPDGSRSEWLDVKKVTVFIGNQGSGKSVVAKLISTFSWMEKALVRGDYDPKDFTKHNRFRKTLCAYHRLEKYFFDESDNDVADLAYEGDAYIMRYTEGKLNISERPKDDLFGTAATYLLPQIMYVPAERNFITYVKSPKELKLSSDSLKEFLTAFDQAKEALRGLTALPISQMYIEYDRLNDMLNLKGNGYKIKLTDSSSGFQSLVPLYLVSSFLAESVHRQSASQHETMSQQELDRFKKGIEEIWNNDSFTEEQRRAALSVLSSKFNKRAFINIVEEPEQNLFPSAQKELLYSLLKLNNLDEGNRLVLTTHSPYIISFLSLAIQAAYMQGRIMEAGRQPLLERLYAIVPAEAAIADNEVRVYQFDELSGTISLLPSIYGIPSDNNYLNQSIKEGNQYFDSLLELEEEL